PRPGRRTTEGALVAPFARSYPCPTMRRWGPAWAALIALVSLTIPTLSRAPVAAAAVPLTPVGGPYWPGWDIARGVAVRLDGTGGLVLDGWGGLHPFALSGHP